MSIIEEKLPLRAPSPSGWVDAVLGDFDRFLLDHAACERKASALAMSFVAKYSDRVKLIEPMISLAREELAHYHEAVKVILKRGLQLGPDEKDPYVTGLLKKARNGRDEHFIDRLLVSAVVEARGGERFSILGRCHPEPEIAKWYRRLGREEIAHWKIFHTIATQYFPKDVVEKRLDQFLDYEAEVMLSIPYRPAVH